MTPIQVENPPRQDDSPTPRAVCPRCQGALVPLRDQFRCVRCQGILCFGCDEGVTMRTE
jgi:hypothetical protein